MKLRTNFPNTEARLAYLENLIRELSYALMPFAEIDECGDGFPIETDVRLFGDHYCTESENIRRARRALRMVNV